MLCKGIMRQRATGRRDCEQALKPFIRYQISRRSCKGIKWLKRQYPTYLASPPSDVSPADLEKYKQQHALVKQILSVFRKPSYSDAEDGKEVARLVGEMQDLGGPPKEIMGDMPECFVSSKPSLGAAGAKRQVRGMPSGVDGPERRCKG